MVANRLKLILPEIISSSQGAFVPGRHIPENTVIAYETFHYMRGKRRGKDGYAALKIDVSKAYDRLEWSFMTAMLLKLGFSAVFVEFLLLCVSTVSFKVLHQGRLLETITPERGLRQGDPLSPYLFILCMEGLSRLIQSKVEVGALEGVSICRGPRWYLTFSSRMIVFFSSRPNFLKL